MADKDPLPEQPEPPAAVAEDAPAVDADADADVEREIGRRSRRSFTVAGLAALAGFGGWYWVGSRRPDDRLPWPLRRAHEVNEQLSRDFFSSRRLSQTYPLQAAKMPKVNGVYGTAEDIDLDAWRLAVSGLWDGSTPKLTLDDIRRLPRFEVVTELRCIEGWSEVVHWAGARFADFAAAYGPATNSGDAPDVGNNPKDLAGYVSMETPDGRYYVGLDIESALHPQTLLCYEMNGAPLELEHGAPLRLAIPVKYGIKNIKRIGSIHFTFRRPADFWAERGYDWYAGF